ncbi:Ribosome-binding factor A [hydrothermal vent metagenome]|uniref:Ribosome-binding factor A n=1 Tax=hydrothermal vent metagenome TaxID=652676 RepID=A0A3B1CES8_9ZZZZ
MKRFHRADRVSEEILKEISNIVQREMKDPGLGIVSVVQVELTRDLGHANVYISVLGSDKDKNRSFDALKRGSGFVRSLLGKRLGLRHVPEIVFHMDDSIERGIRIQKILKEVAPREEEPEDKPEDKPPV